MASLRQKREESLKQYGERALRLRQRLEETDEPFLVQRFRKGLRSKAERRLLASRVIGEEKVTMQELNQQILSICEDDDDSSVESLVDSEASDSGHGSASDDEDDVGRRRRNKGRAKKRSSKKEKSGDAELRRQLEEYAERLKKVEEERESFRVEAYNVQRQAGDGNQQRGFQGNYRGNQQGNFQGSAQSNYSSGRQGGYQGRQGSGGYRQGFLNSQQQGGYSGYNYQGQRNDPMQPIMCFNCGKDGHMARFCREFRGYGQNFGHPNQVLNPENKQGISAQPQGQGNAPGPRITEVPDVAAIEVLSSAVGGMKVVRELVKYVEPAEVYAGERRRHSEIESAGDSIVVRARKRPAVAPPAREEEPAVADPGPSARRTPQVLRDSSPEASDIEMEARPPPPAKPERTQTKRARRQPKPPRRIRMMMGEVGYDVLAKFRDMPVQNLKWGALLDIAPALRRTVGTGLLLERVARKSKGKGPAVGAPVDAAVVNAKFKKDLEEEPCLNFFTKAIIRAGSRKFEVEKALIDAGSVINLASQSILESMGATLYPVCDLTIRTATSALTTIRYFSELDVIVAGVQTKIRIYAIPREFNLSYGLLLSRRWMRQVQIRGNYELDKYYIKDPDTGKYREILRNTVTGVNAVELPTVGMTAGEPDTESSVDEETREELELAEAYSGGDEILREVIGQATDVMRKQLQVEGVTDSEDSEDESGNVEGF